MILKIMFVYILFDCPKYLKCWY